MQCHNLHEIVPQWQKLAPLLSVPHTEDDYDELVVFLDQLIDEVGNDEGHPLASLMETVGTLIENYDRFHYPFVVSSPIEALRTLMNEQGLTENDLLEVGNKEVLSEIFSGRRELTTHQIKLLSQRFQISPATFF